jgi:hypothetical protein
MRTLLPVLAAFAVAFGLSFAMEATAEPGPESAPAAELRGPGAACLDPDGVNGPAPCVQSPLDHPGAALDTVAAAKKVGWPLVALVVGWFALILASRFVPYLRQGKRAIIIAGATSVAAAGINTGLLGGDVMAMVVAAGGVALALVQPDRSLVKKAGE